VNRQWEGTLKETGTNLQGQPPDFGKETKKKNYDRQIAIYPDRELNLGPQKYE